MEVSGQFEAPASSSPGERPAVPIWYDGGGAQEPV
jgi:hypothetical protein